MGSWIVCLLLLGQGNSLQQHGVACVLERLQDLWVPPEQDTLGLHAHAVSSVTPVVLSLASCIPTAPFR